MNVDTTEEFYLPIECFLDQICDDVTLSNRYGAVNTYGQVNDQVRAESMGMNLFDLFNFWNGH